MTEDREVDTSADVLRFVLGGVSRSDDIHDLIREFGPRGRFADSGAGEVVFGLAADALELGGFTRDDLLDNVSLRERFLPEVQVSGRNENYKSDWTLRAVATLVAGSILASTINSASGRSWTSIGGRSMRLSPTGAHLPTMLA